MNLNSRRVLRPFCVSCVICISTCFFLSCGAPVDQTTHIETTKMTQENVPSTSFQEILHAIQPLNDHTINFSNTYPGYIVALCPLYEFTLKDVTCSALQLDYYNQLNKEARKYQIPFFLLLDHSDGKPLQEYIHFLNEKFGVEPDFTKTDEVKFSYPLYYDQHDHMRNSYDIPEYPSILFFDSNGKTLRIQSGYTEEMYEENLEVLKELYPQ